MLYTKTHPVGIDTLIQRKQIELYEGLLAKWNLTSDDYLSIGRCYRNQADEGYIPEGYIGEGEYQSLFVNDGYAVTTFFGTEKIEVVNSVTLQGQMHLIATIDLSKVYQNLSWRADEEVRQDVYEILKNDPELKLTEIITGVENVYREYTAWRDKYKGINYRDMHPLHCFRLNFNITYFNNNCSFQIN